MQKLKSLGCHRVEISRNYIGKEIRPAEVMCWVTTQVHPIKAEDSAIGLVKYANESRMKTATMI